MAPRLALDVGSGPYPCMEANYEWTHMDPNPNPHVEIVGVGTSIPCEDEKFDFVRNSCVIEHLVQEEHLLFIQEMTRVLKPGGLLETVVSDLENFKSHAKEDGLKQKIIESEIQRCIHGADGNGMEHQCLVSTQDVINLYEKVGLEVVNIDTHTRAPRDVIIIGRKKKISSGNDDTLVSIIIPCRNYVNYVEETICSALNQTYKNIEIVAVDDGSTDNSLEVMKKFPIQVIEHPYNKGLPFARNTAIENASGELIVPLDADDQLHRDYVKLCVEGYKKFESSNIGIVRTGLISFTDDGQTAECHPLPLEHIKDELESNRIFVSSMFPKAVWKQAGGYSEDMNDGFEDWEFWLKIMENGFNILTVDKPMLMYRIHGMSKGKVRSTERTLISRQRLFFKHRNTYNKLFVETLPGWKEAA